MTEHPNFGVLLARLSHHRRVDVDRLSRAAAIPQHELKAVLVGGAMPSPSLLRRLAPALNLHTADLFVIADQAVPEDLAPLDAKAGSMLDALVECAVRLHPRQTRQLRQLAQSLPQQDRTQPTAPPPIYEQYQPGYGAMLVRMLRNRNLGWVHSAKILFRLAGIGPLAAATIGAIGRGRKDLTPHLLAGFATVLAIPADDLAALTGIELPDVPPENPTSAEVASLIWDVRRLTADQVRQVGNQARSIQRPDLFSA